MLRPLRQTPAHAPRPQPTDDAVLASAIGLRLAQVREWLDDSGGDVRVDDAQLANCLNIALRVSGLDAFRAGVALSVSAGFPTDYALTKLLDEIIRLTPGACREQTRLWVMEHGLRLPCKDGDEIEWLSPQGEPRAGKVVGCDNSYAACAVELASDGGYSSGVHVRVLMEQIFANRSQQRFDPEVPVLGASYEDAPALAAANPGRASETRRTGTSPGINLNDFTPRRVEQPAAPSGDGPRVA